LFPKVGVQGIEELNWSNMEEYGNIHSVENSLRGEYGMKGRFGHINQISVQKNRLERIINAFYLFVNLLPQPCQAAVTTPLNKADAFKNERKIPETRKAISKSATAFINQMNLGFPQFTHQETNNVKAQLMNLQTNVAFAHGDRLTAAEGNIAQATVLINQAKARILLALQQQPQPQPQPQPQQRGFLRKLFGL